MFVVGDLVMLKSGGPVMVVSSSKHHGTQSELPIEKSWAINSAYECIWFWEGRLESAIFTFAILKKTEQ